MTRKPISKPCPFQTHPARGEVFVDVGIGADGLGRFVVARLAHVEPERRYRIAGLVLLRQRPSTAKGITFMTLEDETGTANLIVHVNTWERFRPIARGASAVIAHGILQRQHGVCHLLVDRLDDLTDLLGEVTTRSRDFR